MIKVKRIRELQELESVENQWKELQTETETKSPFITLDWIKNWWECFGHDKQLYILLAYNEKDLVGIAPLMLTNGSIQFIGTPLSDYCNFIIKKNHKSVLKAFYEHIADDSNWKKAILDEIPSDSLMYKLSDDIISKLKMHKKMAFANECYRLHNSDKEESLRLIDKRDLRRHTRSLERKGTLRVEQLNSKELIKDLFKQHQAIWNARGFRSMFEDDVHKEFFTKVLDSEDTVFWVLFLDDKAISTELGFVSNGTYIAYLQSFDLQLSRNSPGTVLLGYIMRHYIHEGVEYLDLSRGAESYKRRFTNEMTTNGQILLHRSLFGHIMNRAYSQIKEIIMKRPKIHNFLTKYKQRLSMKLGIV